MNPIKNALKFLKPKQKTDEEIFKDLVGEYFWDRQKNKSRNAEFLLTFILVQADNDNSRAEAYEQAAQVIEDFRYFEAKTKGWL
jgi:uncharacterized tellurite resistance protein B-like protein